MHGFSLIELIFVIALLGAVSVLTLDAIGSARDRARDTVSVANMRQHAAVLQIYANDWDDAYPQVTIPQVEGRTILRGCGRVVTLPYFMAGLFWTNALADRYYGGDCGGRVFRHPASASRSYFLSSTLFARPEYWRLETRTGEAQWRVVRVFETQFASSKATHVEFHPDFGIPVATLDDAGGDGFGLALADGSARRFRKRDLSRPVRTGDGLHDQTWNPFGVYGLHTVDGVRGRDLVR